MRSSMVINVSYLTMYQWWNDNAHSYYEQAQSYQYKQSERHCLNMQPPTSPAINDDTNLANRMLPQTRSEEYL